LAAALPRNRFTIQTQRGCPFACEFCAASRLLGSFREKPPQILRKELEALTALDAVQDHGIAVVGCFVLGADGETPGSIGGLAQFLLDCGLADVQVTLQTPFPGSPLRKRLGQAGRLRADRNWDYYTLFDVTFLPDAMTVAELEQSYRQLAGVVYSAAENLRRLGIRRKIWAKSPLAGDRHASADLELR